jgi:hypothetical protein
LGKINKKKSQRILPLWDLTQLNDLRSPLLALTKPKLLAATSLGEAATAIAIGVIASTQLDGVAVETDNLITRLIDNTANASHTPNSRASLVMIIIQFTPFL